MPDKVLVQNNNNPSYGSCTNISIMVSPQEEGLQKEKYFSCHKDWYNKVLWNNQENIGDLSYDVVAGNSETDKMLPIVCDEISTITVSPGHTYQSGHHMSTKTNPTVVLNNTSTPKAIHCDADGYTKEDFGIHGNADETDTKTLLPEGGFQAWLVVFASFLCNGIIFGILNSFGTVFIALEEQLKSENPNNAGMKASLVGSAAVGATFLFSPVSALLTNRYGIRNTAFCGSIIASVGMLLSSFCVEYATGFEAETLYLTYGLMFGGGCSLVYTPSVVILGHHFQRHLGLVSGLAATGSSIFSAAMPHILQYLLKTIEIPWTFRVLSGLVGIQMLASCSFISVLPKTVTPYKRINNSACYRFWNDIISFDNLKNKQYVIWSLSVPLALLGYFVPYVHIVAYVKSLESVIGECSGELLVTCIAITSGFGRILFGKIADRSGVNKMFLQQMSFIASGICTMLLTVTPYLSGASYPAMVIISLIMGIFDGCFITMFGPIAYDLCGPSGASQGVGFILGMSAIPLTMGPPLAGMLYDALGNYTVAFVCAGIPPLFGALLMCCIYRVNGKTTLDSIIECNETGFSKETDQPNPPKICRMYSRNISIGGSTYQSEYF